MATPTLNLARIVVYVKYIGGLKQWEDAIFKVPLANIIPPISGWPHGMPVVSNTVTVKKANKYTSHI